MALYGIDDTGSDEARAAYREIDEIGPRQALLNRLSREREARAALAQVEAEKPAQIKALHEHLGELAKAREANRPRSTMRDEIICQIAEESDCSPAQLRGFSRRARLVEARHALFWRLQHEGMSYSAIGRCVDHDHSTVMNGIRQHERRLTGELTPARYSVSQAKVSEGKVQNERSR